MASLHHPLVEVGGRCMKCHQSIREVKRLRRKVVGYHGCNRTVAALMVGGQGGATGWRYSENDYDWLGKGVYFWEDAPRRAWQWADERHAGNGAVVAVEIDLGRCLDLADVGFSALLQRSHCGTLGLYERRGMKLPKNGGPDGKVRRLDRLVIDRLIEALDEGKPEFAYQTVRCPFEEGDPVYEGSRILTQSHVQIAVRDRSCIDPKAYLVNRGAEE
jgi:hypothetical protein